MAFGLARRPAVAAAARRLLRDRHARRRGDRPLRRPERARAHRRQPGPARLRRRLARPASTLWRSVSTRSSTARALRSTSSRSAAVPRRLGRRSLVGVAVLSGSSTRRGAASCGRSARTRTPPARSARTSSPTSSSRWRSPRRWRDRRLLPRAQPATFVYPTDFEPIFTFFGLRDPRPRRPRELPGRRRRLDPALDAARGHALRRPAARDADRWRRCAS